jgi:methylated-DNA-[protein]-cysteine S-methyltransferase
VPPPWRALLDRTVAELDEYFAGRRATFDLPVDLAGVSDWDRAVLGGAARLRYGEVTSYGRLARMIGRPGAARAVGGALGRNPVPIVIPCHRILAGDGSIGGYGGGWTGTREEMLGIKRSLLAREGVRIPAAALVG